MERSLGTLRPPESVSPGTARTQRPGRSRSPVGSTILIITARGVSRCPGRTHGAVEVAPDYLPLLPGWSAPVRAEKRLRTLNLVLEVPGYVVPFNRINRINITRHHQQRSLYSVSLWRRCSKTDLR